jgi:hypothetical protein
VRALDATAKKERLVWLLRRVGDGKCTTVFFSFLFSGKGNLLFFLGKEGEAKARVVGPGL